MSVKMNVKDKLLDDTLDLSCSDLKDVPVREIAVLQRATNVDLSNNVLTSLPKNFVSLTQIIKLDLSKNMLTEIPENFGEMVQLKHLDLYKNQISRLPLSLGNLRNLRWLDLKENPLTPAVASVAGPCNNAADCQACARNVVTYLANVKLTIEEEQKRLSAAAIENEKLNPAPSKKENKKKKKNAEKEKSVSQTAQQKRSNYKNDTKIEKPQVKHRAKGNKGNSIASFSQIIIWLIMWLLFFTFLTFLTIAMLPVYDEQTADMVFEYLKVQTGLPVKHYYIHGVASTVKFAESLTNQTRDLVETVYRRYLKQNSTSADDEL